MNKFSSPPSYNLSSINSNFEKLFSNVYFIVALKVFLISYGAMIAPNPPQWLKSLLSNSIVKIVLLTIAIMTIQLDFQLALIFAFIFVIGTNTISGRGFLESLVDLGSSPFSKTYTPDDPNSKLLQPQNNVYDGCQGIKLKTLLDAFDGDKPKLQHTVRNAFAQLMNQFTTTDAKKRLLSIAYRAGLPYNVEVSDETAPYISTLLVDYGYNFGNSCTMVRDVPPVQFAL